MKKYLDGAKETIHRNPIAMGTTAIVLGVTLLTGLLYQPDSHPTQEPSRTSQTASADDYKDMQVVEVYPAIVKINQDVSTGSVVVSKDEKGRVTRKSYYLIHGFPFMKGNGREIESIHVKTLYDNRMRDHPLRTDEFDPDGLEIIRKYHFGHHIPLDFERVDSRDMAFLREFMTRAEEETGMSYRYIINVREEVYKKINGVWVLDRREGFLNAKNDARVIGPIPQIEIVEENGGIDVKYETFLEINDKQKRPIEEDRHPTHYRAFALR